ncbi:MAG: hypothetical protein J3Q66DRAFT_356862 [Benniella sp.]|nr:MAG: hypothetical protein J3Q66DRAFT_356862 [Benniella sp.]
MDSTGLSLTGSSVEGQNQGHPTESSNNSDTMWHPQRQRPSLTGSSCGSNTNNSPSRGSHTQRNSMSENISDGSLQYILTNNNNNSGRDSSQGRYHGGSGTSTPGPMSMATTWFGIDHMNPDGSNQLPPLNPPRRSESPAGYPYPYAFSYAPQQPVPYVGYSSMGRSIAFSPGPPYVYAADNSGAMGVYLPAPGSQMTHGHPANDPAALGWQSHIQLAPPQQPIVAQVMQPPPQPGYAHEMYASRMPGPIYSGSQFPQQGHAQIIHYVQVQAPVMHQPSIQLAPLQTILQDPHPQQPQHPQHPHRQQPLHSPTQPPPPLLQDQPQNIQLPPLQPLTQHQQQQILPPPQQPPMQPSSQQRPQDSQRQEQRPQHQPKQNRPEQQVRHPSATLLPPLPPNVLREESGSGRSFSPTSSNSTLVNTTSISNSSNSQRESSSSSSFGRETSSGGESTSRSISAQLESSGQSGTSRSDDTSPGASNESSSTTESPNSTEDVSNSNESGSSSDNVGSRSSSADPTALIMGPIAAGTGDTSSSSGSGGDGSTGEENDTRTGAAGTGSSNGGGLEGGNNSGRTGGGRRRRAKKSVSPSGSGDSSTSSNPLGSVPNSQAPPGRHYRAHHPGQDGSRMAKPNDETQSTSSGTGSVSRSDTMSIDGTHQGRRKHKTTFPSRNLEDASNGMLDSNARGGHTSKPSGRRNQRKVSGGGGGVDGVGDSGSGGSDVGPPVGTSRPRADSDSAGSGSGSGSNSGTLHDSSGKGTSSGTGSTGGNSISSGDARKGRLNRKGKSKRGKGKTNPQAQQQQQQQDQEQQQAPKQAQGQQKQQPRTS